jgi:integrase
MASNDRVKTGTPGIMKREDYFTYSIRVPGPDGTTKLVWRSEDPQTKERFTTIAAAKKARAAEQTDRSRGTFTEPQRLTVGDWLVDFLVHEENRVLAGDIREGSEPSVRKHLIPHIGRVRLQDLTAAKLDRMYGELLRSGLSPKTVRNLASTVHSALELARKRGVVPRNVAKDAHAPKAVYDPEKIQYWTAAQLGDFLAFTAKDRLHPLWVLLAATGMRRGEALALRWSDITTGIRVSKDRVRRGRSVVEGPPKTQQSRRFIALDPDTLAALDAWRKAQLEEAVPVDAAGIPYNPEGHVFTDEIGRPFNPPTPSRIFDRRVKAWGGQHITLHDLRHTHVTLLLANRVPAEVVSKRVGHASVGFTLDRYRHVMPDEEDRAATVIGDLVHGGRHLRSVG